MNPDANLLVKKLIQKVVNFLLKKKDYSSDFYDADIFFVFGSKHKTAMCDWVYGIRLYTTSEKKDNWVTNKFLAELKYLVEKQLEQKVCATDVLVEVS